MELACVIGARDEMDDVADVCNARWGIGAIGARGGNLLNVGLPRPDVSQNICG